MLHAPDLNTTYICVDLEASGPVPGLYNMVSIGGVEVRFTGQSHERGREFYYELQPICDGFDDHAMSIHGISRAHLEANGMPAKDAMQAIIDWVAEVVPDGKRALFVGHNAPFDWMNTAWYFAWAGLRNPFGYNALDTKAMIMGQHRLPWKSCGKDEMLVRYPHLNAPRPEDVHNALADAQFQADILIALLDDGR